MANNRPNACIDTGKQALRLAERISENYAGAAFIGIRFPPGIDIAEGLPLRHPVIDRQAKGRFGYERMAAHRLECRARDIAFHLVVPGHDPDFAAAFNTYLCRSKHM